MSIPRFAIEGVVFDIDGVMTDARLYYSAEGEMLKVLSARDGMGMALLRDAEVPMALVSGRSSEIVRRRFEELGVSAIEFGRMDKAQALEEICGTWGIEPDRVAAVGDDLVDVPMLRRAGFAAAPADADPRVCRVADYVCTAGGGHGAVREVCEIVLRSRGDWGRVVDRFELGRKA